MAYLPLCHVLGRDVAVTLPLISRLVPHFGESPEDLPTTLFESAPTVLFTVPRYLQKFASQVLLGILNSSSSKRATADLALRFARGHARRRWNGEAGLAREALYRACRAGVFVPILNKLGFDRLELVVCAGAPLPPETMALWQMLGVNVVEMYGQTETAGGIITGQRGPFPRPGNVGTVATGWEVKLAGDGEVLVTSPRSVRLLLEQSGRNPRHQGRGRLAAHRRHRRMERERAPARRPRARLHRDLRRQDDLAVVHREYPAHQPLCGRGGRVRPRPQIPDRARSRSTSIRSPTGPAAMTCPIPASPASPTTRDVMRLIGAEIERANGELARVEQIKAFRILPKALDPEEDGEPVTPTRKVKRHLMYERFKPLVESMYDDREERLIAGKRFPARWKPVRRRKRVKRSNGIAAESA